MPKTEETPPETKPGETPATPAPETPPATPAAPAPAALTPEQQEAIANWGAVNGLFKKREDGSLELDPSVLQQPPTKPGEETEEQREAARKDAELKAEIAAHTGAAADAIAKDLSIRQSLEEELKDEPGGDLIIKEARAVMERSKVPISKRTEATWRNAISLARGTTEPQRRKLWVEEGAKNGATELLKAQGIAIPRPGPKPRTEEEMVDDLTPAQLAEAKRRGMDPKAFAKRKAELGIGGRR